MGAETQEEPHATVLFDGVCNMCNHSVRFVLDHDPSGYFRFASLQSPYAQHLLQGRAVRQTLDSVVLIEGDRVYVRSTAALRIARRLTGPWCAFYALILVPRPLRDVLYRMIARYRRRLFGKAEACRLLSPHQRARFLA